MLSNPSLLMVANLSPETYENKQNHTWSLCCLFSDSWQVYGKSSYLHWWSNSRLILGLDKLWCLHLDSYCSLLSFRRLQSRFLGIIKVGSKYYCTCSKSYLRPYSSCAFTFCVRDSKFSISFSWCTSGIASFCYCLVKTSCANLWSWSWSVQRGLICYCRSWIAGKICPWWRVSMYNYWNNKNSTSLTL